MIDSIVHDHDDDGYDDGGGDDDSGVIDDDDDNDGDHGCKDGDNEGGDG